MTWLYHHRKLTQQQIGEELGLSRPTLMRLLRQATEEGLVTISLRLEILRRMEISDRMRQKFGLKEIVVVPTSKTDTESDVMQAVGKTGALYLETNLKPDQILTIAESLIERPHTHTPTRPYAPTSLRPYVPTSLRPYAPTPLRFPSYLVAFNLTLPAR